MKLMDVGTGDQSREEAVAALADELVRARWRGVAYIDRRNDVVALPRLDELAARYAWAPGADRVASLRTLLADALDGWEQAGNRAEARFVRRLFVDEQGRWPGPDGPRGLLRRARQAEGVTDEDQFRKLQRLHIESFARFLLTFTAAPPTADAPPAAARGLSRPVLLALGGVLVLAVVGIVIGLLASAGGGRQHGARASGSGIPPGSTSSAGVSVRFRFDNLGSTVQGGSYIYVYPGVGTAPADRQSNGTYTTGETVPAVCVTTGRLVKSDPTYGETPKQTNQWVRINAEPGTVQYATLTYGELIPAKAALPPC